jgi:hypothetical protein
MWSGGCCNAGVAAPWAVRRRRPWCDTAILSTGLGVGTASVVLWPRSSGTRASCSPASGLSSRSGFWLRQSGDVRTAARASQDNQRRGSSPCYQDIRGGQLREPVRVGNSAGPLGCPAPRPQPLTKMAGIRGLWPARELVRCALIAHVPWNRGKRHDQARQRCPL